MCCLLEVRSCCILSTAGDTMPAMISRSAFALFLVAVVLFACAAWGGFRVHRIYGSRQQQAQPGWCCQPETRSCTVSMGNEDCRAQGGTTFNWNRETCANICAQAKPKRSSKTRSLPAPNPGQ